MIAAERKSYNLISDSLLNDNDNTQNVLTLLGFNIERD